MPAKLIHATGLAPTARILPGPESLLTHLQHLIVDMMSQEQGPAIVGRRP